MPSKIGFSFLFFFFFALEGLVGESNDNSAQKKGISASKHLPILQEGGRRTGSHLNPQPPNLGAVDCSFFDVRSAMGQPKSVRDILLSWSNFPLRRNFKFLWRATLLFLL